MPNSSQTRIQNQEYRIQEKTFSSFLYSKFRIPYSNKGFTLIELMVAISIVAILATIGIVAFGATQATARDAKRKGDMEDIRKAMYLSRSTAGNFCLGMAVCNTGVWVNGSYGATNAGTAVTTLKGYLKEKNQFTPDIGLYVVNADKFYIMSILSNKAPSNSVCSEISGESWYAGTFGYSASNDKVYCISSE